MPALLPYMHMKLTLSVMLCSMVIYGFSSMKMLMKRFTKMRKRSSTMKTESSSFYSLIPFKMKIIKMREIDRKQRIIVSKMTSEINKITKNSSKWNITRNTTEKKKKIKNSNNKKRTTSLRRKVITLKMTSSRH